MGDMIERAENTGDEDIVPINPIEEKDKQIAVLKQALDDSKNEVTALNDCLVKTRGELVAVRKSSNLSKTKIEFAEKITEQRMSNCLSDTSPDLEDELVGLYSTLLDEDNFRVEDGEIIPDEGFLKEVEIKLVERGEIPTERFRLD